MGNVLAASKGRRIVVEYSLLVFLVISGWLGSGCQQDLQGEAAGLIERGRCREAIDKLETAVEKEERGELLYLLGNAYGGLKDFYQSDSYYQRALAADSTLSVKVLAGYVSLGDELATSSKEDILALKSWEKALSLDPDCDLGDRFYHLANHYFRNQSHSRASEMYSRAITSSPLSPLARDARYRLVLSLQRLGRLEEALKWCQESRDQNSRDLLYEEGKIAYSLGEKYLRGGDEGRALQLLRRTIQLGQPGILLDDAHFLLGEIYFQREDYAQALRFYRKVLMLNPYQKGGVEQKARERIREINTKRGATR